MGDHWGIGVDANAIAAKSLDWVTPTVLPTGIPGCSQADETAGLAVELVLSWSVAYGYPDFLGFAGEPEVRKEHAEGVV